MNESVQLLDAPDTVVARKFNHTFALMHAKKDGAGSQVQWNTRKPSSERSGVVFVSIVPQKPGTNIGDSSLFDYPNKVTMGLSSVGVAQIIEVLRGYVKEVTNGYGNNTKPGMIHNYKGAVKTLFFSSAENGVWFLSISASGKNYKFTVNSAEALLLENYLTRALAVLEPTE